MAKKVARKTGRPARGGRRSAIEGSETPDTENVLIWFEIDPQELRQQLDAKDRTMTVLSGGIFGRATCIR